MSIKKHEKYAHKLSGYTLFPLLKLTFFYLLIGNISIHCDLFAYAVYVYVPHTADMDLEIFLYIADSWWRFWSAVCMYLPHTGTADMDPHGKGVLSGNISIHCNLIAKVLVFGPRCACTYRILLIWIRGKGVLSGGAGGKRGREVGWLKLHSGHHDGDPLPSDSAN